MDAQNKSSLSRARGVLRAIRAVWPLTWAGVFLVGIGWASLRIWGRGQADFIVHAAVIVVFLLLIVGLFFVIIGAIYVYMAVQEAALKPLSCQLETGELHKTGFRVPRLKWWPFLQVRVSWETPANTEVEIIKEEGWWSESVRPQERGRHHEIKRRITVRDIFGLTSIEVPSTQPAAIFVLPARSAVGTSPELRLSEGDGLSHPEGQPVGDYVEMRRYAPGDPLRLVLWKAYARSRRLLVRMPERAITPLPNTAAYFIAGPGDNEAACVARTMLESGVLGDEIVFGADGTPELAHTAEAAKEAIVDSVHHRHRGGEDFGRFIRQVDGSQLGRCILFLPERQGPWLHHLRTLFKQLPSPPLLLITIDGHLGGGPSRWSDRFFEETHAGVDRTALLSYYEALTELGAQVQVVHRGDGRALALSEINAMKAAS